MFLFKLFFGRESPEKAAKGKSLGQAEQISAETKCTKQEET